MHLKMAYSGYFMQIPSFNTESCVTTGSFMWKQALRPLFMTSYQNWQMHISLLPSQWTFKWIIDWKKWNTAWVNVNPCLSFPKAWMALEIIYERRPVYNLFAKKRAAARRLHTEGESLGMWALSNLSCTDIQTSRQTSCKNESSYMKMTQTVQGFTGA